jgi:hypothetical protein
MRNSDIMDYCYIDHEIPRELTKNIYHLEIEVLDSQRSLKKHLFITDKILSTYHNSIDGIIYKRNDISQNINYLMKKAQKCREPKGQIFSEVDPYGEENWEE